MSYTTDDFAESLKAAKVDATDVSNVVAAWGAGDGMGKDAGHFKWDADGATEWNGGFLCKLRDGRYAYITGWCDYTGWGCQDGAKVTHFDAMPTVNVLRAEREYGEPPDWEAWDHEPADLNKWIADGAKDRDE